MKSSYQEEGARKVALSPSLVGLRVWKSRGGSNQIWGGVGAHQALVMVQGRAIDQVHNHQRWLRQEGTNQTAQ